MAGHILRMSDTDTVRFLELYQNEPVLWDPTRDDYKKRDSRAAAVKRIKNALKIKGFTDIHVHMKFKNLRSSYSQELKKIAKSTKSGCSTDEIYVPKVFWFNIMDSFLKPHVRSRTMQSNQGDSETHNRTEQSNETKVPKLNLVLLQQTDVDGPSTSKELIKTEKNVGHKRVHDASTRSQATRTKQLRTASIDSDNSIVSEMTKLDETSKRAANASTIKEDSFDHFGKYVGSLLRRLPENRASKLQVDIINMILRPPTESRPPSPSIRCKTDNISDSTSPPE